MPVKEPLHRQQAALAELVLQLAHRAHGQDLTVVHDGDPVAQILGFLQVVGRVEHGMAAGGDPGHHVQDLAPGLGVRCPRWVRPGG